MELCKQYLVLYGGEMELFMNSNDFDVTWLDGICEFLCCHYDEMESEDTIFDVFSGIDSLISRTQSEIPLSKTSEALTRIASVADGRLKRPLLTMLSVLSCRLKLTGVLLDKLKAECADISDTGRRMLARSALLSSADIPSFPIEVSDGPITSLMHMFDRIVALENQAEETAEWTEIFAKWKFLSGTRYPWCERIAARSLLRTWSGPAGGECLAERLYVVGCLASCGPIFAEGIQVVVELALRMRVSTN